jgi:hypothetical protein
MEQVSLLALARPSNSTLPICQHLRQVVFSLLQRQNIHPDPNELLLCEFKDPLAWRTTSVTGLQDFSKFRQRKPDAKCPLNDVNPLDRTLGIDSIP